MINKLLVIHQSTYHQGNEKFLQHSRWPSNQTQTTRQRKMGRRANGRLFPPLDSAKERGEGTEEEKSPRLQIQEQPACLSFFTPFFTQLGANIRKAPSRNRAGGRELSGRWNAGSENGVVTGRGKRKGERAGRQKFRHWIFPAQWLPLPLSLSALSTRRRCRSRCSLPSSRENFW